MTRLTTLFLLFFITFFVKGQSIDETFSRVKMKIPAEIDIEVATKLRETAIEAFKAVGCEGLSRVDFFLKNDNTFVLNEINTLPGFTEISMYPKLWEKSGVPYSELISILINLAFEKTLRDNKLRI